MEGGEGEGDGAIEKLSEESEESTRIMTQTYGQALPANKQAVMLALLVRFWPRRGSISLGILPAGLRCERMRRNREGRGLAT